MRKRRWRTSVILIAMAVALLVSIAVGQKIGDRVLGKQIGRQVPLAGSIPTPQPQTTDAGENDRYWKHVRIISVATDPAFPDPRVTPTQSPSPKPTEAPRPTASPSPSAAPTQTPDPNYTSPPLPVPVVSHEPDGVTPSGAPSAAASASPAAR